MNIRKIFVWIVAIILLAILYPDIFKVKAADRTFDASNPVRSIGKDDHSYDGDNITISGVDFNIDGTHVFGNISLINNAALTHTAGLTADGRAVGLRLKVGNLSIDATSEIDVSKKGYPSRTGYGEIVPFSCNGETCQNGSDGGCSSCNTNVIVNLEKGGNGGGSGGQDPIDNDGSGAGAGGSFVGGGGAGMGYRSGGGGGGTNSGSVGTGLSGANIPTSNQQGKNAGLNNIESALNTYYDNSYDQNNAKNWGYGGGGGMGNADCNIWPFLPPECGSRWEQYYDGGKGGGAITINANNITVEGGIYADGENAPEFTNNGVIYGPGGGGSGGSISLQANTINIGGMLSAKGGNGGFSRYSHYMEGGYEQGSFSGSGGGGGGIIALIYSDAISSISFSVSGGQLDSRVDWDESEQWGIGGDGLIYSKNVAGGPVTPPQKGKVKVIVTWEELGQEQKVEMFTFLRDTRVPE